MASAGQAVDDFGSKGAAASGSWVASSAAMAGASAALTAGLASAVGAAGNFEASMNQVGAVTGATESQLAALSAVAMQVGADTAFSAQQGAQAITELGKAGIPIPDILNGAATATANLAAAGGVDMPRAAEVMSNAMNTFGIAGTEAAAVADTFAGAANSSAADINTLAMGLAQVGPAAQGLGLSLNETVAQLALFSDAGMQGSDAGTSMKTMLASLTPSTKAAREAFAELGLSTAETANAFFTAEGEFVGMEAASLALYNALAPLTDEQRAVALETMFGSDASRAAEITFQAQKAAVEGTAEGYSGYLAAVQSSGQASTVAAANMAGMNGSLEQLRGSIETAAITLGTALTPAIAAIATGLTTLVNAFLSLPAPVQTAIAAAATLAAGLLALGAAIAPVVIAWGAFTTAIAPVVAALAGLVSGGAAAAAAIALLTNPVTLVIAALVALYVAYQTNFLGFQDGVQAGVAIIQAAFQAIADFITGSVIPALQNLLTSGQQIATDLGTAWSGLQATASSAWTAMQSAIETALTAVQTAVTTALAAVQSAIETGWATVQSATETAWSTIQTAIETALTTIQTAVQTAWSAIDTAIGTAMTTIQTTIETAWTTITTAITTALTTIQTTITTAWTTIQTTIQTAMTTIQTTISTAWTTITTEVTTLLTTLQTTVGTIFDTITTTITTKAEEAKTGLITTFQAMTTEAVAAVTALKDQVLAVFADAGSWLVEAGRAVVQGLIDGIGAMAGQLADAVGTMASSVKDGVADTLTIGSPSQVMFQLGYDTGMGFALGIEAALPAVEDATASLAAAAPDAAAEDANGKHTVEGEVSYEDGKVKGEVRANGHKASGEIRIDKVEVRDDRHLKRWAEDTQRRKDRVRARGK